MVYYAEFSFLSVSNLSHRCYAVFNPFYCNEKFCDASSCRAIVSYWYFEYMDASVIISYLMSISIVRYLDLILLLSLDYYGAAYNRHGNSIGLYSCFVFLLFSVRFMKQAYGVC